MEKTATLNLRVNPTVKMDAEQVLASLGIPMSVAIDMYLRQIALTGGIPFDVKVPSVPASIDATKMTADEIKQHLKYGLDDVDAERTIMLSDVVRKEL